MHHALSSQQEKRSACRSYSCSTISYSTFDGVSHAYTVTILDAGIDTTDQNNLLVPAVAAMQHTTCTGHSMPELQHHQTHSASVLHACCNTLDSDHQAVIHGCLEGVLAGVPMRVSAKQLYNLCFRGLVGGMGPVAVCSIKLSKVMEGLHLHSQTQWIQSCQ